MFFVFVVIEKKKRMMIREIVEVDSHRYDPLSGGLSSAEKHVTNNTIVATTKAPI